VGTNFVAYQAAHLVQPDLYPASLSIAPISYNPDRTLVNYRLETIVGNAVFSDASCGNLWIYNGDPDAGGTLIVGPVQASAFQADNGDARVISYWRNVQPLTAYTLYACVEPVGTLDTNSSNNCSAYLVYTDLPLLLNLPLMMR
jgi:hypothetical protein